MHTDALLAEVAVLPPRQATPATAGFTAAATNAAAAAAAVQGGGGLDASVIDGTLQLHNSYRALHAAPALSWSGALAAQAAGWASACSFAHDPDNYEAGENVFACNWLEEPADILRAAVTVWCARAVWGSSCCKPLRQQCMCAHAHKTTTHLACAGASVRCCAGKVL